MMIKYLDRIQFKMRSRMIGFLMNFLRIQYFEVRKLTQGEICIAQQVFGNLINYDKVKIFNIPYLPWQPIHMFIAPNGNIFVHRQNFSTDYSKTSLSLQAIFIHEMTHIMQYQQHTNVILKGALLQLGYYLSFKKYNPYTYQIIQDKKFKEYNIEQQGDIARDIFLKKIPNIILDNKKAS